MVVGADYESAYGYDPCSLTYLNYPTRMEQGSLSKIGLFLRLSNMILYKYLHEIRVAF